MKKCLVAGVILLSGCSYFQPHEQSAEVLHYQCGTMPLTVTLDNAKEEVGFIIDGKSVTLKEQVSGSGARYADDTYTFWSKGDTAFIERNDKVIVDDCQLKPAN